MPSFNSTCSGVSAFDDPAFCKIMNNIKALYFQKRLELCGEQPGPINIYVDIPLALKFASVAPMAVDLHRGCRK